MAIQLQFDGGDRVHAVTPQCEFDGDKDHDRWDCRVCQTKDLWVTINTMVGGTDPIIAINVLADLFLQYTEALTLHAAATGTPMQKRAVVLATVALMQDLTTRCVEPLGDVLVTSEVLQAPGSNKVM